MQRTPEPEYMDIEEEAEAYANADFNEVNETFVNRLLGLAGRQDTLRVLDLGCGPGDIPRRISVLRPNWRIIGADAAYAMLRRAAHDKQTFGIKAALCYVLCDAKQLPFSTHTFDIIVSNSILHHIADVTVFWREVKRMLCSDGGLLFLRDLSRPDTEAEAARIVKKHAANESPMLQNEFHRSLLAAYTPKEVRSQLDDAGLSCIQVAQITDRHLDAWGVLL